MAPVLFAGRRKRKRGGRVVVVVGMGGGGCEGIEINKQMETKIENRGIAQK